MEFYERYPMMHPHVGRDWRVSIKPSLLLVGESHYLPDGATQQRELDTWYGGNHTTLNEKESDWLNTSQILASACRENFAVRAHWIWKNSFEVINDAGPQYAEAREVVHDVAFVNFFLRPAPMRGGSLAGHLTGVDIEFANAAFAMHLERLVPTAVVFLSRLAYRSFRPAASLSVRVVSAPHPTSHWWNRKAKIYGGKRGRDILAGLVVDLGWPRTGARG